MLPNLHRSEHSRQAAHSSGCHRSWPQMLPNPHRHTQSCPQMLANLPRSEHSARCHRRWPQMLKHLHSAWLSRHRSVHSTANYVPNTANRLRRLKHCPSHRHFELSQLRRPSHRCCCWQPLCPSLRSSQTTPIRRPVPARPLPPALAMLPRLCRRICSRSPRCRNQCGGTE